MGIETRIDTPLARAVRIAGSQSAFARICGKNQSSVFDLLKDGRPLWPECCLAVERKTGVPKEELRPDIYPPSEGEADNTPTAIRSDNHRDADDSVSMDPVP